MYHFHLSKHSICTNATSLSLCLDILGNQRCVHLEPCLCGVGCKRTLVLEMEDRVSVYLFIINIRNRSLYIHKWAAQGRKKKYHFHFIKMYLQSALPPYERPWQSTVPPLPTSVEQEVQYSADEEQHGMVLVAWRGPLAKVSQKFNKSTSADISTG